MNQSAVCIEHGIQEITRVGNRVALGAKPKAYYVTVLLACGHSMRIVMSSKNLSEALA